MISGINLATALSVMLHMEVDQMKYVKLRKDGERFWAVCLPDGRARCDSETVCPTLPRYRDVFSLDETFEILEQTVVSMRDHLRVVSTE